MPDNSLGMPDISNVDKPSQPRYRRDRFPLIAGLVAVLFGGGVGELAAALIAPIASPLAVLGAALIDLAPPWVKNFFIALFGTGDKAALITIMAIAILVLAALAGQLERRRNPWGRIMIAAATVVGIIAVLTRANFAPLNLLPTLIAGVVSAVSLKAILIRIPADINDPAGNTGIAAPPAAPNTFNRRSFVVWAGAAGVIGALSAAFAASIQSTRNAANLLRGLPALPAPSAVLPATTAGTDFNIKGLSTVITPNADFYRIDTALAVPQIDPANWRLKVTGKVAKPFEVSWSELNALPMIESYTTLTCVSNEVGGDLIGNAKWLGYPIRELLARAEPLPGADMVLSRSVDGWTAGTPLTVLQDIDRNAILAIGMNGEHLPLEHGFPARLVVPGLYGYVSATKWVTELQVTSFSQETAYWTDRGWSAHGPIKLSSRIDVPVSGSTLKPGGVWIAGVAWYQHSGIAQVELQIDDGPWLKAELASALSIDTWVQWRYLWQAKPGRHTITVRAVGADGFLQDATPRDVIPDGATGYHDINIQVS